MTDGSGVTASHFGLCVTDHERSRRFYTEALGYSFRNEMDFAEPFDTLTELPGLDGHAVFLTKGDVCLELLTYRSPDTIVPSEQRPLNQPGLSHMSVVVEDLDATAAKIEALGGKTLPHTRISSTAGDMMFATDPDGLRIEMWEKIESA